MNNEKNATYYYFADEIGKNNLDTKNNDILKGVGWISVNSNDLVKINFKFGWLISKICTLYFKDKNYKELKYEYIKNHRESTKILIFFVKELWLIASKTEFSFFAKLIDMNNDFSEMLKKYNQKDMNKPISMCLNLLKNAVKNYRSQEKHFFIKDVGLIDSVKDKYQIKKDKVNDCSVLSEVSPIVQVADVLLGIRRLLYLELDINKKNNEDLEYILNILTTEFNVNESGFKFIYGNYENSVVNN